MPSPPVRDWRDLATAALVVFVTVAVLCLFGAGCDVDDCGLAPTPAYGPGQPSTRELRIILASYGTSDQVQPQVWWRVTGLDCANGQAWTQIEGLARPTCTRGMFDPAHPTGITVAQGEGQPIPATSLAHETLHWLLFRMTGDGNASHSGDFRDRVKAAEVALWADYDSR